MKTISKSITASKVQLISALTWAIVMIAASYVTNVLNDYDMLFYILLAGATTHFLMLSRLFDGTGSKQSGDHRDVVQDNL